MYSYDSEERGGRGAAALLEEISEKYKSLCTVAKAKK